MWFLFLLLGAFSALVVYSRRYANPYKLEFIFGKKGAGKSTLMVSRMVSDLKHGWNVYTDMSDCVLPGVRIINSDDLGKFIPEPHSALYLDEAGIKFDNRNYKNFPPELRDFFKYQRKYKCKVCMNSQSFDIDKKIRDVVDHMGLVVNLGNVFSIYRPIRRSITLTEPTGDSESRIADRLRFQSLWHWKITYLPAYFKYFDSYAPTRAGIQQAISSINILS